jgi:hypothetical protein
LFCDSVKVTRHHTLHAYITPLMLSKPGQPRCYEPQRYEKKPEVGRPKSEIRNPHSVFRIPHPDHTKPYLLAEALFFV